MWRLELGPLRERHSGVSLLILKKQVLPLMLYWGALVQCYAIPIWLGESPRAREKFAKRRDRRKTL